MSKFSARGLGAAAALIASFPAVATDGYFAHGYGVKSQGIAGIGIAFPQDALAAATNPAGTAFVGDRVDVGGTWFRPSRSASISGNAFGPDATYSGDGRTNFGIPEFGITKQWSPDLAFGVAVHANGGMNTEYRTNPLQRFGAGSSGTAGVNLEQLFVAPSVAYKPNADHAFGLALNLAYQRFEAKGLGAFAITGAPGPFSAHPDRMTDQGSDTATGVGVRLGWTGRFGPDLTVGATWASKTRMSKFEKYSGLFADGGSFDIPANYGIGVAYRALPGLVVAGDVKRIEYSGVESVGNPLGNLLAGVPFGAAGGPGFGWRDVTVVKIGASWDASERLVVRAGYSHGTQPIPDGQTFLNILAPGTLQDHLSLGLTWTFAGGSELSAAYTHGFRRTVSGNGSIPPGFPPAGFGGGEASGTLSENILGVAYGWKL